MMKNVIECREIRKNYEMGSETVHVLRGVDLYVKEGEFLAVMGPSGSGKSTLMNILGCLDSPTSGSYFLNGLDVSKMNEDELALVRSQEIGFVFQSFNLLAIPVYNNVELPLIYNSSVASSERKALVEAALNLGQVPEDRWNHKPNELSGGQRQRVAIARALVGHPSIILADEPTGNLDSKTGEHILKSFREINAKEGKTIIMITHDLHVAKRADRIITLKDGLLQ